MSPKDKASEPLDIYVRVSDVRARAGESFQSPKQQEERCRTQLKADGLEAGEVLIDLDESGGLTSRPAFDRALERARKGESGGIIVHDLTRFGRYDTMAKDIIGLEESGAMFISCAEKIDTTTSAGRFFLRVMEAMAVMYREQVGERFSVAQSNAVARGVHVSRFAPAGYVKDKDGKLVPDGENATTITRAYQMAADGESPSAIARYLNDRKLPSGSGQTYWKSSRIKRLLANPVYKGQARYGEIVNNEAHTALVDETTWLLAQRKAANSPTPIQESSPYVLSGFARCASCRFSMRPQRARGTTVGSYRCGTESASGRCSHPSSVSMNRLDDHVFRQFLLREHARVWESSTFAEKPNRDESDALEDLAQAQEMLAEVQAHEDEWNLVAYGAAFSKALDAVEKAQERITVLAATPSDLHTLLRNRMPQIERILTGERVLEVMDEEAIMQLRSDLANELQAVFVRPAKSRSNKAPLEDRVHLIWKGEEMPEVPRRGETFAPRPFTWGEAEEQGA